MTIRRSVFVAYSLSLKNGKIYHARAFGEEHGNPGLPEDYTFRVGRGIANDEKSADSACRYAVARFLRENPEYADSQVFYFGRVSDDTLTASAAIGLRGRNWCRGIASAFAEG